MSYFFLPVKNELDQKANFLAYYALLVYIISLFSEFIPVVTNVMMGCILLAAIICMRNGVKASIQKNKVLVGIIIFYVLQIISMLLSANVADGFKTLSNTVPFLLFGIAFLFIEFKQLTWNRVLHFFALATTLASLVGFAKSVSDVLRTHDTGYLYNDNLCYIIGKQAVYFSLYVSIAILIFTYLLQQHVYEQKKKGWIYLAIFWLFIILFLLASKASMLALLCILGIYAGSILIKRKKYMEISILIISAGIGAIVLVKLFPKTLNRFKGSTDTEFRYDNINAENHFNAEFDKNKWTSSSMRAAIWSCAVEVWKEHPVFGTHLGDKNDALRNKYREKHFWYAIAYNKNTHSQYLDVLIGMGTVGFLIFICCYFIYPLWIFMRQKQIFAIMIFSLVALCLITETMFGRYQGIVFLALMLPLASKITSSGSRLALELTATGHDKSDN
jgi:O-antigen ligase